MTERVLAFEAEQEVVWVIAFPVCAAHPVVPRSVAEKQQVTGHVVLSLSPVVEHFHIPTVGRGIRRTAGELIVQLIGGHNPDPQTVMRLMPGLDTFSLLQHLL